MGRCAVRGERVADAEVTFHPEGAELRSLLDELGDAAQCGEGLGSRVPVPDCRRFC